MHALSDSFSIALIFAASLLIFCYIYGKRGLEFRNILLLGYTLRLIMLFADYYDWFDIPNSGADSESFHRAAINNATSLIRVERGAYADLLTFVYQLNGNSRMLAQYLNVLFGMGVILLVQSTIKILGVGRRNALIAICVVAFLPNLNIFSAILLREAWIEFFVALSLYLFIKWFLTGRSAYISLTIASVLGGAYMHAGVIGLIAGYAVAFITYNPKAMRITISKQSITALALMVIIGVAISSYIGIFTSKFAAYSTVEDIVSATNAAGGGNSDYLTWIRVDSVAMGLLIAPLKIIYLLFSPLPTEWRRLSDVAGFLIDGVVYLALCSAAYRYRATTSVTKSLKKYLIILLLTITFIFGYGTKNAGTAFRHRAKLIPVIVLLFAVSTINKREYEQSRTHLW